MPLCLADQESSVTEYADWLDKLHKSQSRRTRMKLFVKNKLCSAGDPHWDHNPENPNTGTFDFMSEKKMRNVDKIAYMENLVNFVNPIYLFFTPSLAANMALRQGVANLIGVDCWQATEISDALDNFIGLTRYAAPVFELACCVRTGYWRQLAYENYDSLIYKMIGSAPVEIAAMMRGLIAYTINQLGCEQLEVSYNFLTEHGAALFHDDQYGYNMDDLTVLDDKHLENLIYSPLRSHYECPKCMQRFHTTRELMSHFDNCGSVTCCGNVYTDYLRLIAHRLTFCYDRYRGEACNYCNESAGGCPCEQNMKKIVRHAFSLIIKGIQEDNILLNKDSLGIAYNAYKQDFLQTCKIDDLHSGLGIKLDQMRLTDITLMDTESLVGLMVLPSTDKDETKILIPEWRFELSVSDCIALLPHPISNLQKYAEITGEALSVYTGFCPHLNCTSEQSNGHDLNCHFVCNFCVKGKRILPKKYNKEHYFAHMATHRITAHAKDIVCPFCLMCVTEMVVTTPNWGAFFHHLLTHYDTTTGEWDKKAEISCICPGHNQLKMCRDVFTHSADYFLHRCQKHAVNVNSIVTYLVELQEDLSDNPAGLLTTAAKQLAYNNRHGNNQDAFSQARFQPRVNLAKDPQAEAALRDNQGDKEAPSGTPRQGGVATSPARASTHSGPSRRPVSPHQQEASIESVRVFSDPIFSRFSQQPTNSRPTVPPESPNRSRQPSRSPSPPGRGRRSPPGRGDEGDNRNGNEDGDSRQNRDGNRRERKEEPQVPDDDKFVCTNEIHGEGGKKFRTQAALDVHVHKEHRCPYDKCQYSHMDNKIMALHWERNHTSRLEFCEICNREVPHLAIHRLTHRECAICYRMFPNDSILKVHMDKCKDIAPDQETPKAYPSGYVPTEDRTNRLHDLDHRAHAHAGSEALLKLAELLPADQRDETIALIKKDAAYKDKHRKNNVYAGFNTLTTVKQLINPPIFQPESPGLKYPKKNDLINMSDKDIFHAVITDDHDVVTIQFRNLDNLNLKIGEVVYRNQLSERIASQLLGDFCSDGIRDHVLGWFRQTSFATIGYSDIINCLTRDFANLDLAVFERTAKNMKRREDEDFLLYCGKMRRYFELCTRRHEDKSEQYKIDIAEENCRQNFMYNLPKFMRRELELRENNWAVKYSSSEITTHYISTRQQSNYARLHDSATVSHVEATTPPKFELFAADVRKKSQRHPLKTNNKRSSKDKPWFQHKLNPSRYGKTVLPSGSRTRGRRETSRLRTESINRNEVDYDDDDPPRRQRSRKRSVSAVSKKNKSRSVSMAQRQTGKNNRQSKSRSKSGPRVRLQQNARYVEQSRPNRSGTPKPARNPRPTQNRSKSRTRTVSQESKKKIEVLTKLGWKPPSDGNIQCFACMEKNHASYACPNVKREFQPKPGEFNKNSVCLYTAADYSQKICGIHLPNGCPRKRNQSQRGIMKKPR